MLTIQNNIFLTQLNVNWFPPAEASLKRTLIQRLIFELLENRSSEASSAACSDEDEPSEFLENHKNKTGVEFLSERCSPAIAQQGNISGSQAGQGIEMTLLSASSMSSQCVNNEGLVLKEFLESGASAGSLFERFPSFGHPSSYYHLNGAISPTEVLAFLYCIVYSLFFSVIRILKLKSMTIVNLIKTTYYFLGKVGYYT
jgi:sentrin-specific protease 7